MLLKLIVNDSPYKNITYKSNYRKIAILGHRRITSFHGRVVINVVGQDRLQSFVSLYCSAGKLHISGLMNCRPAERP